MAAQTSSSTADPSYDYDPRSDAALSSPTSTPESTPFQSLADQNSTPLSMIDDSWTIDTGNSNLKMHAGGGVAAALAAPDSAGAGAGAGGGKPTGDTSQLPAGLGGASAAALSGHGRRDAAGSTDTVSDSAAGDSDAPRPESPCRLGVVPGSGDSDASRHHDARNPNGHVDHQQSVLTSPTTFTSSPRNSPSLIGASAVRGQQYELAPAPAPAIDHSSARSATRINTASSSTCTTSTPPSASSTSASPGHAGHAVPVALDQIPEDRASSHDSASISTSPVRISSVQPNTRRAQPRPRPIVRTTSDSDSLEVKHPTPDINPRFGAYVGNIAQLEATAERLSMTSSIDDAIRDLHGELKRSDSRRSSILAANLKANSIDDYASNSGSAIEHLKRNPSISSSIVSTNIAARHGGYSPGGFVLSPSHSLTGRLRSGSKNSSGRPEIDVESVLSRHGPGKASVRSVRSTKMSLAEISESEPIALTQDALDKADSTLPLKSAEHDSALPVELRDANMPTTDVFHNMMGDHDFLQKEEQDLHPAELPRAVQSDEEHQRPGTSRSDTTFQQCQDAFGDFDGVHWEPEADGGLYSPPEPEVPIIPAPVPRAVPQGMARPQSYMDPESGKQMLYYPARVPAMLNLPPKLSNKPKSSDRDNRRSQVLSMMDGNRSSRILDLDGHRQSRALDFDGNRQSIALDLNDSRQSVALDPSGSRQSLALDLDGHRQSRLLDSPTKSNHRQSRFLDSPTKTNQRDSWLPDPLAGHRESFAALSSDELHMTPAGAEIRSVRSSHDGEPVAQPEIEPDAEPLRRPQKLSRMDPDKRKSRMSNLPPQLRASAYFDIPSTTAPEIEVKDGSAMATLDSILDASAHAPVSAFTDHNYAGKLGSEIYGKEKKRGSVAPSTMLRPDSGEQPHKKRSSFMWLGKRHSHASDDKEPRISDDDSRLGPVNADTRAGENEALAGRSNDGRSIRSDDDEEIAAEEEAEGLSEGEEYYGPPTTLLAELQLRKQQQKERTQRQFPGGMHATLLEMDAVAENQRVHRKDRRVNLAWEDENGNGPEANSDDEDIPLAILAARNQGAQNVMDLNRPIGLMERREIEDNEPLSHRRARLHGHDPRALMMNNRPSMMNLQANASGVHLPDMSPESDEDEIEETLADRKKRLAAKDEAENPLPRARPVSSVFTAELLSQFGDLDDKKEDKENAAPKPAGEETLGQRRRRLQAEREAREREMSFNQLAGPEGEAQVPTMKLRMNMANVLGAHPKREIDHRNQEERQRIEMENHAAREREAKMAAIRNQMPTSLEFPNNDRSGGFRGGAFNDGTGGHAAQASIPSAALNVPVYGGGGLQHRASAVFNSYGAPVNQMQPMQPMQQQPAYGSMVNLGTMNNIGGYNGMNNMNTMNSMNTLNPMNNMNNINTYGSGMVAYGGGMPMTGVPTNRIEQWRQGVLP
ncbi:hypothetical protein G7Z17_g6776 [Cylindrodendrum hubeiense]|uniref:Uncharacterized protein n=1 Tax=Cylindrodendrum hubeiense TaxID=595255 RepID=A0A9P5L7Y1_9HYPO|nr:hypothetical protein G7Z17_g6776 [Cylindrodendrum hubeiense]